MAREDQKRKEQAFKFQIADAQWQQKLRNDAIEEQNVLTAAITEYNKTGDAEKTLKMVPPQHQDVVQQAISGKQKAEQEAQEFKEYIAAAQVIPEDTLKAYEGKSETVKLAVQTYREQIKGKTVPRLAAQTLHSIIEADSKARLYRTEDDVKAPKVPSKTDVDLAKKQIASLVGDQNGDSWLDPRTWGTGEVEGSVLEIAAHDLATRLKNGEALSEELVSEVVVSAQTGAPPPGKTNPEGYTIQPPQEAIDDLKANPTPERRAKFRELFGAEPANL
jgi:hypothetical protein